MITIFVCSPWKTWVKSLEFENEQAWLEYQSEQDTQTEETLARQHILGELDCPWPWYADDPHVVQESEVFEL